MNHTIKSILIAAAITSMLVVGATSTMAPIMQNSFAHKKSDFKKAERDINRNANTNTNTNSADSTSSSNATADNTNNINNSACTVAVTCPKGSIPTPIGTPPPANGTLVITKVCSKCIGIPAFSITVTGNHPQPSSFSIPSNGRNQPVILGPGNFTVTETPRTGFLPPLFVGDCKQTARDSNSAN